MISTCNRQHMSAILAFKAVARGQKIEKIQVKLGPHSKTISKTKQNKATEAAAVGTSDHTQHLKESAAKPGNLCLIPVYTCTHRHTNIFLFFLHY